MFDNFSNFMAAGLPIIGFLAFVVSVITEVIKETKVFKKIPTDLVVIVLSVFLSTISYFALCEINKITVIWYEIIGAVISGFFVAFVAMFGWSKLKALFIRFKNRQKEEQ
ncbi:MAG: ribonuclease [Bacilli bacterium]|nr:ribonuclease [Bacilli bacterium]MDD4076771.1 ribonuclease [Bacilli bacterium]MDD4388054.1 ribonuclease [Bacilli bacterium]